MNRIDNGRSRIRRTGRSIPLMFPSSKPMTEQSLSTLAAELHHMRRSVCACYRSTGSRKPFEATDSPRAGHRASLRTPGACSRHMGLRGLRQRCPSYSIRFSTCSGRGIQRGVFRYRICHHRLVTGEKISWPFSGGVPIRRKINKAVRVENPTERLYWTVTLQQLNQKERSWLDFP